MAAHSHLGRLYRAPFGALTDLYQLTMAYGYWQLRKHEQPAIFHLFYRRNPFGHAYSITAGLALAIDILQNLRFSTDDIQYLGSLKGATGKPLFDEPFLHYLQRLRFECDIDAIPEGTVVYPHQPLLRVQGPLLQAQLIETALLTVVNFSTLIATKAARICQAAGNDAVLEFGLRRAQGIDGGLTASRSAYIGGCTATSNVWAGRYYGIPVQGTHAHSWVMCFDEEIEAFRAYAQSMPDNCVFLVDTYDTLAGVEKAIQVGKELRKRGHELLGVRLDSGDLATLSRAARELLDAAGFPDAKVIASDSLDERRICDLKAQGARIAVWGVGTHLATAKDQPALGGVYKLAAIDEGHGWEPRIKLSDTPIKVSNPGSLQVRRAWAADGTPVGDTIYNTWAPPTSSYTTVPFGEGPPFQSTTDQCTDLLVPVFRAGELVYDAPALASVRQHSLDQQQQFAGTVNYPNGLERTLFERKQSLIQTYQTT